MPARRPRVLIIGAGAAGLSAARTVVDSPDHDVEVILLEARDRPGGRVLTHSFPEVTVPIRPKPEPPQRKCAEPDKGRQNTTAGDSPVTDATAGNSLFAAPPLRRGRSRTRTRGTSGSSVVQERREDGKFVIGTSVGGEKSEDQNAVQPAESIFRVTVERKGRAASKAAGMTTLPPAYVDIGASVMHGCGDENQSVFKRALAEGIRAPIVAGGAFYECTEHARWFDNETGLKIPTKTVSEMHSLFWLIGRCLSSIARASDEPGGNLHAHYEAAKAYVLENMTARTKPLTRVEEHVLDKIRIRSFAYCSLMSDMALLQAAVTTAEGDDPVLGAGAAADEDFGEPRADAALLPRNVAKAATLLQRRVDRADNPPLSKASRRPSLHPDRIVLDGYTPFLIDKLKIGLDIRYNTVACDIEYGPSNHRIPECPPECKSFSSHDRTCEHSRNQSLQLGVPSGDSDLDGRLPISGFSKTQSLFKNLPAERGRPRSAIPRKSRNARGLKASELSTVDRHSSLIDSCSFKSYRVRKPAKRLETVAEGSGICEREPSSRDDLSMPDSLSRASEEHECMVHSSKSMQDWGVRVRTRCGECFTADWVIVTLPLGVLKGADPRSKVTFRPALSDMKQEAINSLGMGVHNKVVLRFHPDDVFWPKKSPQINCLDPRFQFFNLHAYGKPGIILTHVFGGTAFSKGYDGLDDNAVVEEVLAVLKGMFHTSQLKNSDRRARKTSSLSSSPRKRLAPGKTSSRQLQKRGRKAVRSNVEEDRSGETLGKLQKSAVVSSKHSAQTGREGLGLLCGRVETPNLESESQSARKSILGKKEKKSGGAIDVAPSEERDVRVQGTSQKRRKTSGSLVEEVIESEGDAASLAREISASSISIRKQACDSGAMDSDRDELLCAGEKSANASHGLSNENSMAEAPSGSPSLDTAHIQSQEDTDKRDRAKSDKTRSRDEGTSSSAETPLSDNSTQQNYSEEAGIRFEDATRPKHEEAIADPGSRVEGSDAARFPCPIDSIVTRWDADPFSLGSYSFLPCGADWSMIEEMSIPEPKDTEDAKLFFAGEHCDDLGWQCVHGACESGTKAAEHILERLAISGKLADDDS